MVKIKSHGYRKLRIFSCYLTAVCRTIGHIILASGPHGIMEKKRREENIKMWKKHNLNSYE